MYRNIPFTLMGKEKIHPDELRAERQTKERQRCEFYYFVSKQWSKIITCYMSVF